MKTYDLVKMLMLNDGACRNSDKYLMWKVWQYQNLNINDYDTWIDKAAHPKSIIEARRKLQRDQERRLARGEGINGADLLIADDIVRKFREKINMEKGTHIYRDEIEAPEYTKHKIPKAKCPRCGELLKTEIETEPGVRENSFIAHKFLACPNKDYRFEVIE